MNLKIIKKCGLSKDGLMKICEKNSTNEQTILLFPEFTFKEKFTLERILNLSTKLPLDEGTHAFISAYVLETGEEKKQELVENKKEDGGDDSLYEDEFVQLLFGPRYKNTGFVISSNGGRNQVQKYQKYISTHFDSLNESQESKVVRINEKGVKSFAGVTYDGIDFEKQQIAFPSLYLEGKTFEFRVCADIKCGTRNNPDIVLVSAHNLYSVQNRKSKSISDKQLIVNDSGRFFAPIGYNGSNTYRTSFGFSKVCKKEGISISSIK